ncbi:MAG: PQQ-binding-like beta-propeller repeat protein [Planctomycetota bacterium]|nr:PQQ-binding-like beta-propeller repeat protein [Planctomycetota bacterium]
MFQTSTCRATFGWSLRVGLGTLLATCGLCLASHSLSAEDWPQWRGPNSTGVATSKKPLPVEFSPTKNVRWSAEVGEGICSTAIVAGRLFTTAMLGENPGNTFVVLCFDAATGEKLWRREMVIEGEALPKIHESNSYASASPAADDERVYVYHARLGMMAFDAKTGEPAWKLALPEPYFVFDWGPGMSPVIHGDRLFFCQDDDLFPAAYCLDKKTGEILWKDDRGDMACCYSHPVICETPQGPEVVIAGTGKMIGYDYNTGHRKWASEVFCRNIKTTPVTFDGIIYVSVESVGISYQWRVTADANGDGKITRDEILNNKYRLNTGKSIPDAFWEKFHRGDENQDGVLEGDEIDKAFLDPKNRGGLLASEVQARLGNTIDTDADKLPEELGELQKEASIQAVRGGGEGDVSKTHVLWLHKTKAPSHIVSPLVADGRMFLIKQGGITASFDIAKGQPVWERRRVGADGSYLAAPVFGDGKIYVVSESGVVSVIESGPEQKILANNDMGEAIAATPALVDGHVFLRTRTKLYCIADMAK